MNEWILVGCIILCIFLIALYCFFIVDVVEYLFSKNKFIKEEKKIKYILLNEMKNNKIQWTMSTDRVYSFESIYTVGNFTLINRGWECFSVKYKDYSITSRYLRKWMYNKVDKLYNQQQDDKEFKKLVSYLKK